MELNDSLKLTDVSYMYPQSRLDALNGVNIKIQRGSFTGITGRCGSGKTTLLKIIAEQIRPDSGKIENGIGRQAMMFQFPEMQLFGETVLDDVMFGPLRSGLDRKQAERVSSEMLERLGFERSCYSRNPFRLSGGQMRLAAAAGILVLKRDIYILDEPFCGLDKPAHDRLMSVICNLGNQGCTIVMATHDINDVLEFCTQSVVLEKGRIIYSGKPSEIRGCTTYESVFADRLRLFIPDLPARLCTQESLVSYLAEKRTFQNSL